MSITYEIGSAVLFLGRSGRWVDGVVVGHDENGRTKVRLAGYNGTIAPDLWKLRQAVRSDQRASR